MQKRRWLSFGLATSLLLATGAVAWAAITSSSFGLYATSLGGSTSSGGDLITSTSYRVEASIGGLPSVRLSSASFRACSGFVCTQPTIYLRLTSLLK